MRLAVLASGSGSNLQALIDRAHTDPEFAGTYEVVVSDRADAFALDRARAAGIPAEVVAWTPDRDASTRALLDLLEEYQVEAVIMAGFMRIVGPAAIVRYPSRILNIHPSLLPAFPGADAIGAALAHGVKVTGVTVHIVDEQVDHGPIVAQVPVPIQPGDDRESLRARIQEQEHALYPAVVRGFVDDLIGSIR